MLANLGDAAGASSPLISLVGLKRLFGLFCGFIASFVRIISYCVAEPSVNLCGGILAHVVRDVGVNVQRGRRRYMTQQSGECFDIHSVFKRCRAKCMAKVVETQ